MSLEKLRRSNLQKTSKVTECGEWEEVNSTITELQFLQQLGQHLNPRDILKGPLPNIERSLAECILKYAEADQRITVPINTLKPRQSALGPAITPAPKVEFLNRTPVAKMRVCGWEADAWFKDGSEFIHFWNRLHPSSLECIEMDSDEKLVAVLYTSLQGIRSLFNDLVMILEVAENDSKDSREITFQIYREAYQSAARALVFLCRSTNPKEQTTDGTLRLFSKTMRGALENAWRISQVLKTRVNVDEYERVLENGAFYAEEFYKSLVMCNEEGTAWLRNRSPDLKRDRALLDAVSVSLSALENLNRALSIDVSEPYGFLDSAMQKIQKSFRGMSIAVVLPADETVPDATPQN